MAKTKIRFLGGPYDGLSFDTACQLNGLVPMAELPINQAVLWALQGRLKPRRSKINAVAVYAINDSGAYHFVKQRLVRPAELKSLENWCAYVISSEKFKNK